jgi:hypothetical protein
MKSFWGVVLCSLIEVYLRFGGTLCLLLQDKRVNDTNSKIQAPVEQQIYMGTSITDVLRHFVQFKVFPLLYEKFCLPGYDAV